jgi:hypothetical protein
MLIVFGNIVDMATGSAFSILTGEVEIYRLAQVVR